MNWRYGSLILLGFGSLIFGASAHAMTARELYEYCTLNRPSSTGGVYCSAFFIGYARGLYFASESPKHGLPPLCIPGEANSNTLRAAFAKEVQEHPDELDKEDHYVIDLAALDVFRCKKK